MGKVNFNWNNYTGEHMGEPLRVKPNGCTKTYELDYIDGKSRHHLKDLSGSFHSRGIKPLIKSPSDLTDDEVKFVTFGYEFVPIDIYIERYYDSIYIRKKYKPKKDKHVLFCINKLGIVCEPGYVCDYQQILNRLYSLHVSIDYAELIKNNKAVRKE